MRLDLERAFGDLVALPWHSSKRRPSWRMRSKIHACPPPAEIDIRHNQEVVHREHGQVLTGEAEGVGVLPKLEELYGDSRAECAHSAIAG